MPRRPPAEVRRQLRQEANLGCVVCGNPLIQYHHIDFYSDEEHHDPDRMVALCNNHHRQAGPQAEALTPEQLYEYKSNPHNDDIVDYEFYFESEMPYIKFASNRFGLDEDDEMTILQIAGQDIIKIYYRDGILQFSAALYDRDGNLIGKITGNEWWSKVDDVWDLKYKPNRLKIWHDSYDIGFAVEYDSDVDEISLRCSFYVDDIEVDCTPNKLSVGKEDSLATVRNSTFRDLDVCVAMEDDGRVKIGINS
jgi:hypothetical protein